MLPAPDCELGMMHVELPGHPLGTLIFAFNMNTTTCVPPAAAVAAAAPAPAPAAAVPTDVCFCPSRPHQLNALHQPGRRRDVAVGEWRLPV
jgi:hypothetical protein